MVERMVNKKTKGKILLVQNQKSKEDMAQLKQLTDCFGVDIEYGITDFNKKIVSWVYSINAIRAHDAQEYIDFFNIFVWMLDIDVTEKIKSLVLHLNNIWQERYCLNRKLLRAPHPLDSNITLGYILWNGEVELPAKEDNWNSVVLAERVPQQRIVCIRASRIVFRPKEINSVNIIVKISPENEILFNGFIRKEQDVVMFSTGNITEGLEIKAYPNIFGRCANIYMKMYVEIIIK